MKRRGQENCAYKSNLKKLKNSDPLFYEALRGSKEELDLETSLEDNAVEEEEMMINGNEVEMENDSEVDESEEGNENEESIEEEEEPQSEEEENVEEHLTAGGKITQHMIKNWEEKLADNKTAVSAFKNVQQALSAAVESIKGSEEQEVKSPYVVKGPQIFNAIIRLCLRKVPPSLHRLFGLNTLSDRPTKNKKWTKLLLNLKKYLKDLILLIKSISEPSMIEAFLKKGVLSLLPFYVEFPALTWRLTRHVATLWCTSHEQVRVLSLVALFRLIRSFKEDKRDKALKLLYISYVNSCRFTSPSVWPVIDFMRMSLAELYGMDQALAYRHGFIYIRQLAFHLRNAMLLQKKERLQLVYNWQFVHCLHFWVDVIVKAHPSPILQSLIYPLIQISDGVLTLMKSPKYYPITFHICTILTELSSKTDTFIPVIPYLLEILSCQQLRTRPKKNSLKPFQWECIIKVSRSQMDESAFTDGLVDKTFECFISYLNTRCNSIGFPELLVPMKFEIKTFLKKCRVADYNRKMNQLWEKVSENSEFIKERRKDVTFEMTDAKAIQNWEIEVEQSSPPLRTFYLQWKAMKKDLKKREEPSQGDKNDLDEFSISAVRKRQRDEKREIFDEEQADGGEIRAPKQRKEMSENENPQSKRSKKSQKLSDANENDFENNYDDKFDDDDVKEMKLSDYEDESDDDEDDEDEDDEDE